MGKAFEKSIICDDIRFKYARGIPDTTHKEIHGFYEILFIEGTAAEFISLDGRFTLPPETTVVIPKETFHQFIITDSNDDYERLALNFNNVSGLDDVLKRKFNKIHLINDEKITQMFIKLKQLADSDVSEQEKITLLKTITSAIVIYVGMSDKDEEVMPLELNPIIKGSIEYINENFRNPLTLDDISKKFNISVSGLAHLFKSELNTTVHQYIIQRPLIEAHKKILSGVPATIAAVESGFNDYSGFYLQYKREFGKSPSIRHRRLPKKQ